MNQQWIQLSLNFRAWHYVQQQWVSCMPNIIIMEGILKQSSWGLFFALLKPEKSFTKLRCYLNIEDHQAPAANESAIFQTPRSSENDLLAFGFVDRRRRSGDYVCCQQREATPSAVWLMHEDGPMKKQHEKSFFPNGLSTNHWFCSLFSNATIFLASYVIFVVF